MKAVNTQLARIHVLLTKINKLGVKADYVIDATNGREHSCAGLTFDEANEVINVLDAEEKEMYRMKMALRQTQRDREDAMRKKIISCCRKMGWHKSGKADMYRIEAWVLKFGYLHKKMNDYSAQELPQLVTQAENMKNGYLASLK
jgi:succinate dehydrogenase flavin-adding protein (antitoxin of CptAB toxin-antitoxin module)